MSLNGAPRAPKVVALGGGHGLHATLSALRLLNEAGAVEEITAVVTVADNGGSSGRLRNDFGVLPPGDLRMALAALCGTDEWGRTWADVFQHRFAGEGDLRGHAIGNLIIVGLWERLGSPVEALDWAGRLLGARGRVLPMSTVPLDIVADVQRSADEAVSRIRGQVQVATAPGNILHLSLEPRDAPACPEAVEAVHEADWVLLGPGSWYTSVLPHLMIPGMREALQETKARKAVLLNLVPQAGETSGFSPEDHLRVLHEHAPGSRGGPRARPRARRHRPGRAGKGGGVARRRAGPGRPLRGRRRVPRPRPVGGRSGKRAGDLKHVLSVLQ